jgi:hypothetical protein
MDATSLHLRMLDRKWRPYLRLWLYYHAYNKYVQPQAMTGFRNGAIIRRWMCKSHINKEERKETNLPELASQPLRNLLLLCSKTSLSSIVQRAFLRHAVEQRTQ